jgi:hypothetical protein
MGQIKFTDYVPLNIVGVNSASKTLAADNVTGMPIPTGVGVGESFYISAKNAALLSTAYYPVYPGWYRVVQVDTGATAANIVYGAIGGQANLTNARLENNVTDQANVLSQGIAPCVFLTGGLGLIVNSAYVSALPAMTPGNFTIVQDSGDATVLVAAGQTVAVGSVLVAAAGVGTVTVLAGTVVANTLATVVGVAEAAVTMKKILNELPYKEAWGYQPIVPMTWDCKTGPSWGQLSEWKDAA